MEIAICASLDFTNEIEDIANKLKNRGFKITIPLTSELILKKKVSLEKIKQEKADSLLFKRAIRINAIKRNFERIKNADAILVLNLDKNSIKNHIGGNTFLEIGFAYILSKKIFLLNPVPEMIYTDEIKTMQPIVLKGDLSLIS